MKRLLPFAVLLTLLVPLRADAFINVDLVAQVQRIEIINQAIQQVQQIDAYRKEFERYKKVFDNYFLSFRRVYRRLSGLDWGAYSASGWGLLGDHLIRIWKTFDERAWQTQVIALRTSPVYAGNPAYRKYVDDLVRLSEDQAVQLKREEAHLIALQSQDAAHRQALERFKQRNAELVTGSDAEGNEIPIGQQIALTNAILIKLAGIQAESKIVEQRLLTQQKEARNLIMRMKQLEIEAQRGDQRNLALLLERTKTR